ncbi:FAD synthetase family protein [Pseudalkalibacillus decolorationis]|uniref:FAD synthetase family protein n=1 Tax=Pseudalkalibacillus decolorationis TaxID=163879 RepID=UPI002147D93D|nr:FAD synthetase family protein [Pseudalkalibacillus decolorationis]
MEIYTPGALKLPASALTIGALDGVHLGHQALLLKTKERAEKLEVPFVVYTFDPPPKVFFKDCLMLTSLDEKLQRLNMLGVEHVVVGKFDETFTKQEVPIFIEELKELNPIEIWEGPNFLFGKNRKGNVEVLRRYFNVGVLNPMKCEQGETISSSRIRQLVQQGNYPQAKKLLGDVRHMSLILENSYAI